MDRFRTCALAMGAFLCSWTGVASADQSLVQRGEYLARAGDCTSCHTKPGGAPFAGGDAINSPFGPMYPPNITSDKTAGIGGWTDDEFYKAMHEGIGNHGEYLYPAFPYPWFTKISRDDVHALKAYFDTVPPVSTPNKPTRLAFPFNVRTGVAAWNEAFFKAGEFKPDPAKSDILNRGAYLVEGLGHCGDCHTPKGPAMEPIRSQAYSGGQIDDWYAPNITSDAKRGIGAWSDNDLFQYLKTGTAPGKGVIVGPMAQVVHESLAYLTDDDVHAIVSYLKSTAPIVDYKEERPSEMTGPHPVGESVYLDNCASCHQVDGKGRPGAVPALAGSDLVRAKGPEDVIRVILAGRLATGTYAPMPAVGYDMSDQDIADVTDYIRTAWSNAAPVISKTGLVGEIRAKTLTTLSGEGAQGEKGDPCKTGDSREIPPIVDPDHEVDKTLASLNAATMMQAIPSLIARVKAIAPQLSQADIVNGLTLDYCRIQAQTDAFHKAHGRTLLNRFSLLVYSELVSHGEE